jgi:hypothetical protein
MKNLKKFKEMLDEGLITQKQYYNQMSFSVYNKNL